MKKIFALFLVFFGFLFVFTSCGDPKEKIQAATMEDLEVMYDGNPHNLVVEGAPKGAEIKYNQVDLVEPGEYKVVATIIYKDARTTKQATLKINKLDSQISAEKNQTYYVYSNSEFIPEYTLNNNEQTVEIVYYLNDMVIDSGNINIPGTYKAKVYAKESAHYKSSDAVEINLTTYSSQFEVSYDNTYLSYDGDPHSLTLSGELPNGYTVTYENNTGTEVGEYFATAKIKDSANQVVETHRATLTIDNPHNEAFEVFLDEFLVEYFEGDLLSVNIFFENPENYGLEHYDAKWYTYTKNDSYDSNESVKQFKDYLDELHAYEANKLNQRQKLAYNRIESFLNYYYEYYQIKDVDFQQIVYVDQFGGYVADFGTYMEAYTLRSEQEVMDLVSYLKSTLTAFPSYVDFVNEKAEKGYALSDFTLEEMIKYLNDVLREHDPENDCYYYLKDVLSAKVDSVEFLTDAQKTEYKNQISKEINDSFIPGVKALKEGLEKSLGKLEEGKEGYWSTYEKGKDIYLLELNNLLGLNDFDINAYIKEVDQALKRNARDVSNALDELISKYNITSQMQLDNLLESAAIFEGTPEEMLEYLYEFAKTIVPELPYKPDITVKEMDEASAKVSNAVAYYMKSAIDNFDKEYITLNPVKLGDSNDVLGTLAHEGYPGHLYAYCLSKKLDLHELSVAMTSTAHGEGWATYVELKLYEHAIRNTDNQKFKDAINYLIVNHKVGFLLETRIDLGIHMEGWKEKEIADLLDEIGYSTDYAKELFNQMIEMPTTYNAYGYGKYLFIKLHEDAKAKLGKFYNEIEFNEMILSKGWTTLGELVNTYENYMTKACHKYGIETE